MAKSSPKKTTPSNGAPKANPKSESKAEPKNEPRGDAKGEGKGEAKAEAKGSKPEKPAKSPAEPGRAAKAEPRAEAKGEPKAEGKAEPRPEAGKPVAATNGKPPKNQAGLTPKELETYRTLLLEKRRELVGDMVSHEQEALQRGGGSNLSNLPIHMADMGTDNYEQEFTLGLMEKDRNLLREINAALGRIQDGTFGICEGTGKPIGKPRLEAQPWARHSIEYARKMEKRMGL